MSAGAAIVAVETIATHIHTLRLDELEARMARKLMTQDQAIAGILDAIRQLMAPPAGQRSGRSGS